VAVFYEYEYSNEHPEPIKGWEFDKQLSDYELLMADSAPYSE
jgi:hypothetical protein